MHESRLEKDHEHAEKRKHSTVQERLRSAAASIAMAVAGICGFDATGARAQGMDDAPPAHAAAPDFVPYSRADWEERIAELRSALARLDAKLATHPHGEEWKTYLGRAQLEEALRRPEGVDLQYLKTIHARFDAGTPSLEFAWFKDVRDALHRAIGTGRAIGHPGVEEIYRGKVAALFSHLDTYDASPTPETAAAVSAALGWLREANQAESLTREIWNRHANPNVFVTFSKHVLAAGITQPAREVSPISDTVKGMRISGTGVTQSNVRIELQPSRNGGVLDVVSRGETQASTVGKNSQVQVSANSVSHFTARTAMLMFPEGFSTGQARADVNMNSSITGVDTGRILGQRIARNRVEREQPEAGQIAAQRAADEIATRLERETEAIVSEADRGYQDDFRSRFLSRRILPNPMRFSSSPEALLVTGVAANPTQLGAPTAPPEIPVLSFLVRIHESAINNAAAERFSGQTFKDNESQQTSMRHWLGILPAPRKTEGTDREKEYPLGFTFAQRQPITLTFGQNQFTITLRAARYFREGKTYSGMNVSATYRLVQDATEVKGIRIGDLQVLPPTFVPGKRKLSSREITFTTIVRRNMEKRFPPEMVPEKLVLCGCMRAAGKLKLVQWGTSEGWMVLNFRQTGEPADD